MNSICRVLNVNKSSYLYWLHNGKYNNINSICFLQLVILKYFEFNGIYGSPKLTVLLNRDNVNCSISKVSRAMRILGIKSIVSKRFPHKKTTLTINEKKLIVNLIKDLNISYINQVWTTDITYIHTINDGTFYLISFIDYYSKKVISWGLFSDQKTDKILIVLSNAVKIRKPSPGLICHSDKGSQMRSNLYRQFLKDHNFIFSYTSINHSCDENAAQESFHASLKKEKIYLMKLYTYEDAYKAIYDYIEGFYNPIRIHSSIGYLSPINFENCHQKSQYPL